MMEGAYGVGKAGAAFDPLTFIQRPQVILRAVCWLFSVIIFGCISSQGWQKDKLGQEKCLYNGDSNACNYGVGISVIAFLASIGFIVGEYLFEQMSSIKTRKHYVLGDLGFSAFWAFMFFIGFCYLTNQWGKTDPAPESGGSNMQAAIAFSFFSVFSWAGLAYLAFLRYKQGSDQAFAPSYEAEPGNVGDYSSYPDAVDPAGGYSHPPFSGNQTQSANHLVFIYVLISILLPSLFSSSSLNVEQRTARGIMALYGSVAYLLVGLPQYHCKNGIVFQ